jgi:hypothetical protein
MEAQKQAAGVNSDYDLILATDHSNRASRIYLHIQARADPLISGTCTRLMNSPNCLIASENLS